MLKSAATLLFVTLAWHFNRCLAEPKDVGRSVCLLDDPPNQCGQFCLMALRPMLDHIVRHQDEWMGACGAAKANETQGKLDQLQEALSKVVSSLATKEAPWEKINPEDFRARLERMESQNTAQMEVLQAVKTSLESSKQTINQNFVKAGSRYFFVENNSEQNWFSAAHTCRRMGGHLASPRKEDLDALNIKAGNTYWLGISDLADEGRFISSSNGNPASFLNWKPNEPNNHNSQHCVTLDKSGMDDDICIRKYKFICQADNEN